MRGTALCALLRHSVSEPVNQSVEWSSCGRNLPTNLSGSNVNIQEGRGRASLGLPERQPSALRDVRQTAARPRALQTIFLSDCTQGWREWRAGSQTSAVAPNYCDCSLLPTHRPARESDKTMINRNHYPSFSKYTPSPPYHSSGAWHGAARPSYT